MAVAKGRLRQKSDAYFSPLKPIPKKFSQMLQLFGSPWVVSLFAQFFGDPEIAATEPLSRKARECKRGEGIFAKTESLSREFKASKSEDVTLIKSSFLGGQKKRAERLFFS